MDNFSSFTLFALFEFCRENEAPNNTISTTLLKEVQEIEQIKNDSTCTERRVLGKLIWL